MKVGDEVTHDYSLGLGIVAKVDRTSKYPYYVEWFEGDGVGRNDWYRADVLTVTEKAPRSSTER